MSQKIKRSKSNLYVRVCQIINSARGHIVAAVNSAMVQAYWLIGCEIIKEEQKGKRRAAYGAQIIEELSKRLSTEYGKGWSASHLWHVRQFYLTFRERHPASLPASGSKRKILHTLCAELSWSHYRLLMRVDNPTACSFYEVECVKNRWSVRELERQIGSLLYERLALSREKKAVKRMAMKGQEIQKYEDLIKDPYVLEFTGLESQARLYESSLEQALCDNLSKFLLELGKGFAFIARQKRISIEGDHFYIDLVFYNTILRCYLLIDLKVGKLTHQDIGQMQMYVHYYDREVKKAGDNPSVGLILCGDKREAVVQYTLPKKNRQIFASRYKLYLPTETELRRELEQERRRIEEERSRRG